MGDICAIVYCLERTLCDELSAHLSRNGISCAGNLISYESFLPLSTLTPMPHTLFLVHIQLTMPG